MSISSLGISALSEWWPQKENGGPDKDSSDDAEDDEKEAEDSCFEISDMCWPCVGLDYNHYLSVLILTKTGWWFQT